ncbi:hypothetical protein ILYODFUR_032864 [Ilyodon furcidens]|uniref:Uncharacterized protein n=1 Tax=Ilyodon furcidens TaxID=33524 RepID=A0ABV0UZ15_9TELE
MSNFALRVLCLYYFTHISYEPAGKEEQMSDIMTQSHMSESVLYCIAFFLTCKNPSVKQHYRFTVPACSPADLSNLQVSASCFLKSQRKQIDLKNTLIKVIPFQNRPLS